jgi:anti-sigma regulatory factor (Ser/Thr protein kinase)
MSARRDHGLVGDGADVTARIAQPQARLGDAVRADDPEFQHEAAFYSGADGFLGATLPFIGQALAAEEPILVAVSDEKIGLLRSVLGTDARRVRFEDMSEMGSNPARIIPEWLRFVGERQQGGGTVWGVGEPIGPDRSGQVLVECQLHESLLNVAFAQTPRFNLLCPYDADVLDAAVLDEAHRSHPLVSHGGVRRMSDCARDFAEVSAPWELPLTTVPLTASELPFSELDWLPAVRRFIRRRARAAGLSIARTDDLVLAVNEVVANSLVHGGGSGVLRIWQERDALVCEVSDAGRLGEPLAGRLPPVAGQSGGWGLWLANQLCELVQLRSYDHGNVVRLRMTLEPAQAAADRVVPAHERSLPR